LNLPINSIEDIEPIFRLTQLRELDLTGNNMKSLPEEIDALSKLEKLNFYLCHELQELPKSLSKLRKLGELNISKCESLR
jgi:Leucine-rich repeat (LRR) protein